MEVCSLLVTVAIMAAEQPCRCPPVFRILAGILEGSYANTVRLELKLTRHYTHAVLRTDGCAITVPPAG